MPTTEVKIWLALRERVESLPLDFPVAWPAETFTPPHSGSRLLPYIRVGRVSVEPVPVFLQYGGRSSRTGSLILTLVHPLLSGAGVAVYDQYAGRIAAHFAEGTSMYNGNVCVTVTSTPHVQPGYEDNGYWTVPVMIPWRTFS